MPKQREVPTHRKNASTKRRLTSPIVGAVFIFLLIAYLGLLIVDWWATILSAVLERLDPRLPLIILIAVLVPSVLTLVLLLVIRFVVHRERESRGSFPKLYAFAYKLTSAWIIVAIMLIVISVSLSLSLALNLTTSPVIFDAHVNTYGNAPYNLSSLQCISDRYDTAVQDDQLHCHFTMTSLNNSNYIQEVYIWRDTATLPGENSWANYTTPRALEPTGAIYGYDFDLPLDEGLHIKLLFSFATNDSSEGNVAGATQKLSLEEATVAQSAHDQRVNIIYSLLALSISISFVGIFTGVYYLRELWRT